MWYTQNGTNKNCSQCLILLIKFHFWNPKFFAIEITKVQTFLYFPPKNQCLYQNVIANCISHKNKVNFSDTDT